jgi:hypothetical protein
MAAPARPRRSVTSRQRSGFGCRRLLCSRSAGELCGELAEQAGWLSPDGRAPAWRPPVRPVNGNRQVLSPRDEGQAMGMTGFLRHEDISAAPAAFGELLRNASIEVMPRTAAKIHDFRPLLQKGSRVYIAHIRGTLIDEMVETARRLTDEGFQPMPHLPARIVPSHAALELWARRYREEAGVTQALLLGGGRGRAGRAARQFDCHARNRHLRPARLQTTSCCRASGRPQGHRRGRWHIAGGRCPPVEAGVLRTLRCRDGDRYPICI